MFEALLVASLVKGIQMTLASRGRVDELRKQRNELLLERAELAQRLEYIESSEYLEKVARDELNLALPGETTVIVPEGVVMGKQEVIEELEEEKQIWEKWWEVLIGE